MRRPVGGKWVSLFLRRTSFSPGRVATVATLPSALFDERFCSLGASWVFSFQPVLPPVSRPLFHLEDRSWARPLTQSPELGFWLLLFLSKAFLILCGRRHCSLGAVAQGFVNLSAHPQPVQQHCQLSRRSDHPRFFPFFPPRSASFSPQRRRSLSTPNGPRIWWAPCTSPSEIVSTPHGRNLDH